MAEIDWSAIRRQYETTAEPVIAIAREHGISHTAINKRARKEGWGARPAKGEGEVGGGKGEAQEAPKPAPKPTTAKPETRHETAAETPPPETRRETAPETARAETEDDGLTPKQRAFVREYLVDLNATQAAIRAGYSEDSAAQTGYENLRKPRVAAAIDAALAERVVRTRITSDNVLRELYRIASADPRRVMKWGPDGVQLLDSEDLDDDDAAIVSEVSQTITAAGGSLKVKLHDKLGALRLLAQHLGLLVERKELTGKDGGPVQVEDVNAAGDVASIRLILERIAAGKSGGHQG